MDYPVYYTLKSFKDNFKDYFYKNVKDITYTDYLTYYRNSYETLVSEVPYQEIILSKEHDLISRLLDEERYSDEQELLSLLPHDEKNFLDYESFINELFSKNFELKVFSLYDHETALEITKALSEDDGKRLIDLTGNYEEEFDTELIKGLENQSREFYFKYLDKNENDSNYEKYDAEHELISDKIEEELEKRWDEISKNDSKRWDWASKLFYKDHLIHLVEETCKQELINIRDFTEHELELEFERKKQHTDPNKKEEAEPLTRSQIQRIGLLVQSGIIDFLRKEYPTITNNQLAGFFEEISRETLKQKSTNTHFTQEKHSSKYPIQNKQDQEELSMILSKYGMRKL
ncbi:hypothetical protein [Chryseobacterium lathyri]|uniref:Uncharacterized protein n=1 Tax=Chryseobacterium lathyri TaxID=395933 RepID=A0ABT9SQY3_9FLAO|nr:hypothetical protein [Chryseobacterium lathyri]MDP9961863.1 hypothetical protein [Chryseobacterium lathyri]